MQTLKEILESYKPTSRKIWMHPSDKLFKISAPVTMLDENIVHLAADMAQTMRTAGWGNPAGLAAPQVGESVQLFVLADGTVVINPEITSMSKSINYQKEGCYSLGEGVSEMVERPQTIWVKYTSIAGREVKEKLNGFAARVFCHEWDHLVGKLCINK